MIYKDSGRQWPIAAEVSFTYDPDNGGPAEAIASAAIDIPTYATVIGGGVIVDVAWDSATSAALDIGDDLVPNRYSTSVDLKVLGYTSLDLDGFKYPGQNTIDVVLTNVGTPTVGSARLVVQYAIEGKANETQPVQA
jgi:hypothetical protein